MPRLSIIDRDPLSARVILAIALLLGAFMRFFRLGIVELSGDEAASWAAAAAPSLSATIAIQHELNAGKLALHDLTLHAWVRVFGDSEAALRGLSALFGVACIALVFVVARELMARLSRAAADSTPPGGADSVAATSALIAAVSFLMVRESREARMYAMMLALMLAQVGFFLRAERRGGAANHGAVAIFTALGVAANFTALLVIGVEAAWIGYRAAQRMRSGSRGGANSLWALGAAIVAGLLML
ncbi:MAG: hypothetical protein WA005_06760, partial [Candidatus Binataceae bacterium]